MMRNDMNFALVAMISDGNETQNENGNDFYALNMVKHTFIQLFIRKIKYFFITG